MTKSQEYRLNSIMRKIIKNNYNNNSAALAKAIDVTRQTIYGYYHNKQPLGWRLFYKIAVKSNYKIKISVKKNLSE